jgi:hypothetical protein
VAYYSRDPFLRPCDEGLQLGWAYALVGLVFYVRHVAGAAWGGLGLKPAWAGLECWGNGGMRLYLVR